MFCCFCCFLNVFLQSQLCSNIDMNSQEDTIVVGDRFEGSSGVGIDPKPNLFSTSASGSGGI